MILLLGATGYIGQAFLAALQQRGRPFTTLSRSQADYSRFDVLLDCLRKTKPDFLVNAAGYTGKPNVDACETARADTIHGNVVFPVTVSHACAVTNTPWGHVSSGCIYSGAITSTSGENSIERDLNSAPVRELLKKTPKALKGFSESEEPNFSF